ncbi:TonB-dependent receptor PqqU [Mucilaginibacter koreensis]
MLFKSLSILLIAFCITAQAQPKSVNTAPTDTLKQVIIRGYLSNQPALYVPASVSTLSTEQLQLQSPASLVPAMNTLPGVRMEERTPGSYRLSIRGSLLRSPFGIRNIKVYFDDLPLTDAGGNTYLNALDFNSIQGIEVLKGPDGSLFGANSGGVVLVSPVNRQATGSYARFGINAGSYGLLHENASVQHQWQRNQLNISQAYQTYDGYRDHSYMQRHYVQAVDRFNYTRRNQLRILGFYSDLSYQTPGGLTLAQYQANPRAARYPTATLPGAIQQQIRISTKMTYGGAVNEAYLTDQLKNTTAVYGSYVDFSNPFITNYEQRYEGTYGLRSYFTFTAQPLKNFSWQANAGIEWQQTNSHINNYGNRGGTRDTAQAKDDIHNNQHFFFIRYTAELYKRLHVETALSLNFYRFDFRKIYPLNQSDFSRRSLSAQLMPRIALSYQFTGNFVWRASVSRGYSPPALAEIRPTDNIINTNLQAENGWNYETGFRLRNRNESLLLDVSAFYYRLQNAIVRRLHPDETEYYLNAGGTRQPGLEASLNWWIIRQNGNQFIRGLQINQSYALSKFNFNNYQVAGTNYSGNRLTGVPRQVSVSSVHILFPHRLYAFLQYNATSRIPLNDANTVYASSYHLLQAKAGWQFQLSTKSFLDVYAGADNLLNERYSLGNDLNAVGNRYYNAAPLRNFYGGMSVRF